MLKIGAPEALIIEPVEPLPSEFVPPPLPRIAGLLRLGFRGSGSRASRIEVVRVL